MPDVGLKSAIHSGLSAGVEGSRYCDFTEHQINIIIGGTILFLISFIFAEHGESAILLAQDGQVMTVV